MEIINKILCKTIDFMKGVANFVGTVAELTGRAVGFIVEYTIVSAFVLAVGGAAVFLWMYVPYFAGMALIGDDINSIWQMYAMFGIFAVWIVLSKIVHDLIVNRK